MSFKTSKKEITDLVKAWLALSLAFTILLFRGGLNPIYSAVISIFAVGTGFVMHEMGHKIMAQKYGCWAEFRSNDMMLLFAVGLSFLGFIFAAPGAVMIQGNVGVMRNGKISVSGPLMNLVLALLFIIVAFFSPYALLTLVAGYCGMINAWLGAFNLIPFGNFDGRKILRWNKLVYGVMVGVAAILVISSMVI